jgi:hypothetical protein
MMAFMTEKGEKPEIREVTVPPEYTSLDTKEMLNNVFRYGQNEVHNDVAKVSVSAGDVVELHGDLWLVKGIGFSKMSESEFIAYSNMDRRDRFTVYYGK